MLPVCLLSLWRSRGPIERDARGLLYGLSNGILTALGILAFNQALTLERVSLVSPVTSLYPLLTVLLACVFLRERLSPSQWLGLALSAAAIVIFAL
jgi:transporter family protein